MSMKLLTVEKSKSDIEKLNQLLKDRLELIEESKIVRGRLARGKGMLKVGLEGPSKLYASMQIMSMNQHIIDALDTKALHFIDTVYDSAISNIESEIERISEDVMYNLIKANY